ncbi:MAG: penicillin-binding transpeptidase domain-containing protein [Anaerolineales bacterium]
MSKRFLLLTLVIAWLVLACTPSTASGEDRATPTPALPPPSVTRIAAPDAGETLQTYLEAYRRDDYTTMYSLLAQSSRAGLSEDDFGKIHAEARDTMSAYDLEYQVIASSIGPRAAQMTVRLTYHTALFGDLSREIPFELTLENGRWHILWTPGLILPELQGGGRLVTNYSVPARGDIYDRQGQPIATQSDIVAIGIVPGQINPDTEEFMLGELSKVTGLPPQAIYERYANALPDWYIPIGETNGETAQRLLRLNLAGLVLTPYNSRFYYDQGIAPQTVGYLLSIQPENLRQYRRQGYRGDERVGAAGIEKSAEDYLAGKHGATLYVASADGSILNRIASAEAEPAASVYLTIDRNLQLQAQRALMGFRGAIVVIEVDTGRVLALASSPGFDPNLFDPQNRNSILLNNLLNDPANPLYNRATQGEYPLGSVFKIITMAAGMESGLFAADTTYDCQYDFTELPNLVLHDWTWDHCQQELQTEGECKTKPSGVLTLPEGLMRSCNPWFWHIGVTLYRYDRRGDIANMARAFGLGAPTGIQDVAEASGNIGEPQTLLEITNQSIGQGDVLVTPLQVARFIAAIANGGTLYRPQIIEKVQAVDGSLLRSFRPEAVGTLPLRAENLQVIRDAMVQVVKNPRGTAYYRFSGLNIPLAGKTGTAESGIPGSPHAWFAGFTMAGNPDKPDIAVAVIVENAGEGSDYAAPIFRRVIESYFYGQPRSLYWWESTFGVTRTPTPLGGIPTKTPKP